MILQGIMPNASNLVRFAGSTPCMSSIPRCCQSSPRKHCTKPCISLFSPSPQRLLLLLYAHVYTNACLCGRSVGIAVGAGHRDLSTRGVGFPGSEDLHAILGDKERVLYNIISNLSMPAIFHQISLTELRSPLAVNRCAGPVVGPSDVPVLTKSNHGLNGESHAGLALANLLVLGVVRNVGRAVEQLVDAVAAVRADDTAVPLLGDLLDDVAKVADQGAGLDRSDGGVQTVASSLHHPDGVGIGLCPLANVVRLIEIAVVALVVQRNVNVQDIAVEQNALVGNAVADDLVERGAYRLGEVVVVQGRGVGLLGT